MKPEFDLHFCLCWAEYFMFVRGLPMQTADAQNSSQNKPWGIQPLYVTSTSHLFCPMQGKIHDMPNVGIFVNH